MMDMRQMNPNLMRPSGFNFNRHQRKFLEPFFNLPQTQGVSSMSTDRHFRPVMFFTGNRGINRAVAGLNFAMNQSDILFENLTLTKLFAQGFVRLFIFSNNNQARSIFVQAMNYSYSTLDFGLRTPDFKVEMISD